VAPYIARRNARIASAVLATAIPSVCLSVCPSVHLSHAGIVLKRRHVANKLLLWAQKWQLEFNVDKCKVMHVDNKDDGSTYYMEGSELTKVNCENDLGVWISDEYEMF